MLPALLLCFIFTATSNAETEIENRAVMFERTDRVNLAEKEIPDFHRRTEITDSQNRLIKGEWIAIDRKNQTVKFRRSDGKEFDLALANLAPHDRAYAELETGHLWQIDPLPTPLDIIKEDIRAFVSMDETHIHLRCVLPSDPSTDYVPKFPINLLTDRDRELIKEKTGREVPILPRPAPDRASQAWKYPKAHFGHEVPKFTPSYYPATLRLMKQAYTPREMVDAVRTRTMTAAFIHELDKLQYDEAEPGKKAGKKSLAEILRIIGEKPSPLTEEKSLKADITRLKLAMYEEKVPRDPAEPERFKRDGRSIFAQPGVPIDAELQAFQFIAQYLRLNSNQPRIPLATLLENTTQKYTGIGYTSGEKKITFPTEQRRKFYTSHEILPGIEKTYGHRGWRIFTPERFRNYYKPGEAMQDLFDQLTVELIRHHIRIGIPVYARQKSENPANLHHGIQLVITGFKAEAGKPLMFEAIAIKGSLWGSDPYTGEYQITETTVAETEVDALTAVFLEKP